jgi:pimeloyl-ACP methyl ester carboxylesterase
VVLHDVKVVEQPFAGGADVQAAVGGGGEPRVRFLEDAPGAVQAVEERGPPPGAFPPVQPLPRRKGEGPLPQMLGAEQLATNGAGEQILAGVGTAWGEAGSEPDRLERSDSENLGWVTGAVYDGSWSKASGRRSSRRRSPRVKLNQMLLLMLALAAGSPDSAIVRDIEVAPGEILRTTTLGAGRPLVLIPGMFGAAYGYRMLTGPLVAQGYQCIIVEPLGYGWSSHPKKADYSFTAQTERVGQALDTLGITEALFVAQSSGASIAFRLAIVRPDLVRGLLSISGGPAESAATAGLKKAFRFGAGLAKLAMDETMLRHDVRKEIVKNSGDTTWVTDAVIRAYTGGQTADMHGSIDAFHRMSKSKERESLASRLHELHVPVRLLIGTAPHPAAVPSKERDLLTAELPDFRIDSVAGSGQYIHEEQPAVVLEALARLAEVSS